MKSLTLFQKFVMHCITWFGNPLAFTIDFVIDQFEQVLRYRAAGWRALTKDAHSVVLSFCATMDRVRPTLHLPEYKRRLPYTLMSYGCRRRAARKVRYLPSGVAVIKARPWFGRVVKS